MIVEVYHNDIKVAEVDVSSHAKTVNEALEYAYFSTQNIEGSWSLEQFVPEWGYKYGFDYLPDGTEYNNSDYSRDVTFTGEYFIHEGRRMGQRSSTVGDIFVLNGKRYEVAPFGFEEVE